jgi:prevent-host-death family protein
MPRWLPLACPLERPHQVKNPLAFLSRLKWSIKQSIFIKKEIHMQLAITQAKARLTDLVRRAEAGEEIVLTRHGHAVVRLVAVRARPSVKDKANLIAAIRARAALKAVPGPAAARSQDFLYDDEGLPS